MMLKNQLSLERLIGKIDNDYNLSESDWIPRVAAWAIDALSQMQVLPMDRKRRRLEVNDRIATFPCTINAREMRVFDKYGCEIKGYDENYHDKSCCANNNRIEQLAVIDDENKNGINFMRVVNEVNSKGRYFILDGNNIEITFDTDEIEVETLEVATYFDEYYQCDVPYIYDNGLLLEALAAYCMFKYLSRGSTHPIFSLTNTHVAVNPYMQWQQLKPKAEIAVKIAINKSSDGWNNFFYNSTFLPRG